MSCYHPLLAQRTSDPKKPVKIVNKEPFLDRPTTDMINKALSVDIRTGEVENDFFLVPCGKCIGCRLDYSREWADRMTMEALSHPKGRSWFLTLTYDDEHLPNGKKDRPSLKPNDLTDFMKRLRRHYEYHNLSDGIRFYACGEYGSKTFRPHYHVIVYGLDFEDKEPFFLNKMHQQIYKSELLSDLWGNGIVSIGGFDWRSAAYTARYVLKKQKGENAASYYEERGIEPEFVRMSNRPGIALPYFETHSEEIYEKDNIVLPPIDGKPHIIKPPRYFDTKYESLNALCAERLKEIKARRVTNAQASQDTRLQLTDLDLKGYFELQERSAENSAKLLKRLVD